MSALVRYSMMRFAMFVLVLAVLALAGASTLVSVAGAALVSMLLAYVLLRGPREAAARVVAERATARLDARAAAVADGTARRPRLDDDADVEDRALDGAAVEQTGPTDQRGPAS